MPDEMKMAKQVSISLVTRIDPENVDAVEDGFESLSANGFKVPGTVPLHAFHIPPEVWSYAQSVAVFVGGIFAGAVKDILKARLAKLLERLLNKGESLTKQEGEELLTAVDSEGAKLGVPEEHRKRLKSDFRKVLEGEENQVVTTPS
jgi:hypothetical protein